MRVSVDFETRSPVDLKTRGAFVYFEHRRTEVLMCAYHIDGDEPRIWDYREPPPERLFAAIRAGAEIHAYNAAFEALGFDLLADRRGWPRPRPDQFVDTMAAAVAMGLPRALKDLSEALGLATKKDKEGERLIRKFSLPKPNGEFADPADHAADFELFKSYCLQDVAVERAAASRLLPLSPNERRVWLLNQTVNRRGLRIDLLSARGALALCDADVARMDREIARATGGAVRSTRVPAALLAWAAENGAPMASAAKGEIARALEDDDLPDDVRAALELRQEAAKTSTRKLKALMARASADGRVRGAFLYHAASTGRESSVGVNFNNMPRPRKIYADAVKTGALNVADLFEGFRSADPNFIRMLYGPDLGRPLHLVSDAMRGFIWAGPNQEFIAADYSSIEGVVAAWLAGERWKLDAYRELIADANKPDLYRRAAARIVGSTTDVITKDHPLRQSVGKVSELALGYGGGVSAFASMAAIYGVDLDALHAPVWEAAPESDRRRAVKRYERCLKARDRVKTDMLTREAWLACELVKIGWRKENPEIVKEWAEQGDAMRAAILAPGTIVEAGKIAYVVRHGFLFSRLPSRRCLAYGKPKLRDQVYARAKTDDGWADEAEVMARDEALRLEARGEVKIEGKAKAAVTALGVNSTTKKYERFALYEGLNYENLVQAIARDLLVNGMFKAEAAGYSVVLTVYDEIVCEVPRGQGDVSAFETIICEPPDWGRDLPLKSEGWLGKRYRK